MHKPAFLHSEVAVRFLYILPMLVVWFLFLLAFWPGILTADSIDQWGQIIEGRYSDWHPVSHTLVIWLTTRLWNSPAAFVILQIFALSLTVSWGLSGLKKIGLTSFGAWFTSGLFAISPVNSTFVITLWKDVLYSVSFLLLTIIILLMVITRGKWINSNLSWIGLGFVCAFVTLFRHNGFPVALTTLVLLIIIFRKLYFKKLLFALLIYLSIWFGVRGPLYSILKVDSPDYVTPTLLIHHIGAHLNSGTYFTEQELTFLNSLRTVDDKWGYSCYFVDPTIFNSKFNWYLAKENKQQIQSIFLRTLLINPRVNLRHMLCSSSLVWRITQPTDGPLNTFSIWRDTEIHSIIPNKLDLETKSRLSSMVPYLFNWIASTVRFALVWRPAIYLYLALLLSIILSLRFHNWRYLLVPVPVIVQSAILMLVNSGQDVRYQYGVYLVGLFLLSTTFLSGCSEGFLNQIVSDSD